MSRSARHARRAVLAAIGLVLLAVQPGLISAQAPNRYAHPARVRPAPTASGISVRDLQIRLYQFADDSMQGRQGSAWWCPPACRRR
ncbi:MAG: hypothetical protein ACKOCV_04595 [Gemmatimonadota bacterium]